MLAFAGRLRRSQLFELALTIALAIGLAVCVQAYAVKPYRIPSASMEPTLQIGDRVLVNRAAHRLGADPHVGQIVVFTPPAGAESDPVRCGAPHPSNAPCTRPTPAKADTTYVKRVVAVGGDTITIQDGHVIRNGRREADGYTAPCGGAPVCNLPTPVTVPAGEVFLMGDNRGNSEDSRYWGPIPVSWVIGQVEARYWPLGRVGTP